MARRAFSEALRFDSGFPPALPAPGESRSRLLYLHVPFCEQPCPYCSFHRVPFEESRCRAYFDALRKEIGLYRSRDYDFSGVYIGGGTPTMLIDELAETIALIRTAFSIRELSCETNPNHLTEERMKILQQAGVDRLSVGVQSFDDSLLKKMGRLEKYGSCEEIASCLRQAISRFKTLNVDMIFNFPGQAPEMVDRDLETLLGIGIDQVTWYPLMVSNTTRRQMTETFGSVQQYDEERFYRQIVRRLVPTYRLSSAWCFSRQEAMTDEYICDYDEYAGLGSGSIGYLGGLCYANTFAIEDYIARIGKGELPITAARVFSLREQIRYTFLMGLFGTRLSLVEFEKKYGMALWRIWLDLWVSRLIGAVTRESFNLVLTDRGRYLWVVLMREFFTEVNNFRDHCRSQAALGT